MRNVQRVILFTIATITLAGCAGASLTHGPSGRQAVSLNCSGWARNWGMCLERAGEICGARGYTVVNQSGDRPGYVGGWGTSGGSIAPVITRTMLVECN
jgi:hypothetical protein